MPGEIQPIYRLNNRELELRSEALRSMTTLYGAIQCGNLPVSDDAKNAALLLLTELSSSFCAFVKDEKNFKKEK